MWVGEDSPSGPGVDLLGFCGTNFQDEVQYLATYWYLLPRPLNTSPIFLMGQYVAIASAQLDRGKAGHYKSILRCFLRVIIRVDVGNIEGTFAMYLHNCRRLSKRRYGGNQDCHCAPIRFHTVSSSLKM